MLENEYTIPENIEEILKDLSINYPQMYLDYPLLCDDFDLGYFDGMNSYEFKFASYLVNNKNLLVFREPKIKGCSHVPDFYIFNSSAYAGKIVELTLYDSSYSVYKSGNKSQQEVEKSIKRKHEQINDIKGCGIPYVILYREQLENVRRDYILNLF